MRFRIIMNLLGALTYSFQPEGRARRLVEALHGFDEGGLDHMDSYLGSDEEGLCGSGGYGGMAGLASFNALGLDDMRDDVGLLDSKRGKVDAARLLWLRPAGRVAALGAFSPRGIACANNLACSKAALH